MIASDGVIMQSDAHSWKCRILAALAHNNAIVTSLLRSRM
jgi:hypothetical protein